MKTMKKIFALTLALMLVFSLALTTNAANLNVDGALKGATYNMYQMATVEQNETTGSILYYTTNAWKDFWNTDGAIWFHCDEDGLVTIKDGVTESQMPAAAKAAQATATADNVENPTVTIAAGTGYYLMTSDKGSLCTLATITNDITIKEKNAALPRIDKTVENAKKANAAIGDTVEFTLTVTTGENHNNEMNYIIHDTMSAGLTLNQDSIVVKYKDSADATEEKTLSLTTDYTVHAPGTETEEEQKCTFEIKFTNTLTTKANGKMTVTYTATVNEGATDEETNKAEIDDSESEVTVTTTEITLKKEDGEGTALAGAEFELYIGTTTGEGESATTTYTKVPVVLIDEENNVYRPAVGDEKNNAVEIVAGTATVKGLDPDLTYYVLETQAPDGYVKIDDHKVVEGNTVTVENVKGEELPETGGMGTTLLYTLGGLMVAAAAVMLITKKRMSAM